MLARCISGLFLLVLLVTGCAPVATETVTAEPKDINSSILDNLIGAKEADVAQLLGEPEQKFQLRGKDFWLYETATRSGKSSYLPVRLPFLKSDEDVRHCYLLEFEKDGVFSEFSLKNFQSHRLAEKYHWQCLDFEWSAFHAPTGVVSQDKPARKVGIFELTDFYILKIARSDIGEPELYNYYISRKDRILKLPPGEYAVTFTPELTIQQRIQLHFKAEAGNRYRLESESQNGKVEKIWIHNTLKNSIVSEIWSRDD